LIDELSLHDAIERVGYVSHAESVRRLCGADVLVCVVARAEESRAQFPAKVFEYMRSGRPVLGVMPDGPTAEILRRGGATTFARYDDERAIASALIACADRTLAGTAPRGDLAAVQPYERRRLAQQLASILDRLAAERRAR
jgi:glycosyltransferase involved in cell wall biosynthesis